MSQMRSSRPGDSGLQSQPMGLALICALNLIVTVLAVGFALIVLFGDGPGGLALFILLLAPVELYLIRALWRMKPWAVALTAALYCLGFLGSLVTGNPVGFVLNLAFFVYLVYLYGRL